MKIPWFYAQLASHEAVLSEVSYFGLGCALLTDHFTVDKCFWSMLSSGLLALWPYRGSSRLEGLAKRLLNDPICQPHTTIWGYSKILGHLLCFNPARSSARQCSH